MIEVEEIVKYVLQQYKENKIEDETARKIVEKLIPHTMEKTEDAIAIIGMDCKLPDSENAKEFFDNLMEEKNSIHDFPESRRRYIDRFFNPDGKQKDIYSKGGYLREIDQFDAEFFNIPSDEAIFMEPYQRLVLESAYKTLEDGNVFGVDWNPSVGVYVGLDSTGIHQYSQMVTELGHANPHNITGSLTSLLAGRISYALGLEGPTMVIDTACSSGLVAVAEACKALKNQDCNVALAGGCNIMLTPLKENSSLSTESGDDEVRAFDQGANGMIISEGVCFVALKRLSDAIKDNDAIYSVILSSVVNSDGASSGLTSPNPRAQIKLYKKAWEAAKIKPESISYIEAHGTGTLIGDYIELDSLITAFREFTTKEKFCGIGSVKSNIGHTKGASGVASLIKVVMAMQNRVLPASIHIDQPNQQVKLKDAPIYLNDTCHAWDLPYPLRAGVSSFSFSGTNAHLVIEEYKKKYEVRKNIQKASIFTLSAKSENSLMELIHSYQQYLNSQPEEMFENICYTANVCRPDFDYRIILLANHMEELKSKLQVLSQKLASNKELDIYYGVIENKKKKKQAEITLEDKGNLKVNELKSICEAYILGQKIPWSHVYPNQLEKVHLPVYSFEKNKVWIDSLEQKETWNQDLIQKNKLYPFIDERIIHTKQLTIYRTKVSVSNFWPIAEHTIHGQHVLPGTTLLDMITYAANDQYGENNYYFKDLAFLEMVAIEPKGQLSLLMIMNQESDHIAFEVISQQSETVEDNKIHMTGCIIPSEAKVADVAGEIADRISLKDRKLLYQIDNRNTGDELVFGKRWWIDGDVYQGNNEDSLLADVKAPEQLAEEVTDYCLYPSMMDVAINYVVGALGDEIYVPFSIKEFYVFGKMTKHIYSYVTKTKRDGKSNEIIFVDVCLVNEQGEVFGYLKHYAIKRLRSFIPRKDNVEHRAKKNTDRINVIGSESITKMERIVAEVWARVLDINEIDINKDIYKLGGSSLHCIHITNDVNKLLNLNIDLVAIFDYPTVAEYAEYLESYVDDSKEEQTLSLDHEMEYALSEVQLRMWFIQKLYPDIKIYNLPMVLKLDQMVEVQQIQKTMDIIIRKHSVFRTIFEETESGVHQRILDSYTMPVKVIELNVENQNEIEKVIYSQNNTEFDFTKPLIEYALYKVNNEFNYFFIKLHHLVCDGWSSQVFLDDLMKTYENVLSGKHMTVEEMRPRYVDWIKEYKNWEQSEDYKNQLDYWIKELSGKLPILELPIDGSRPERFSYKGDAREFYLDTQLKEQIKNVAATLNCTGNVLMQTFFFLFLNRLSMAEDIILGIPSARRDDARYEEVIGDFINILCIRIQLGSCDTLQDLIEEVKAKNIGALRNGKVPLANLIDRINPERDLSRNPIFSVFFQYYDNIPPINEGTSQFDLSLYCRDEENGVYCRFEYNTDLFSSKTIDDFESIYHDMVELTLHLLMGEGSIHLFDLYQSYNKKVLTERFIRRNEKMYWSTIIGQEYQNVAIPCNEPALESQSEIWRTYCVEADFEFIQRLQKCCLQEEILTSQLVLASFAIVLSKYGSFDRLRLGVSLENYAEQIVPWNLPITKNASFRETVLQIKRLLKTVELYLNDPVEVDVVNSDERVQPWFQMAFISTTNNSLSSNIIHHGGSEIVLVCKQFDNSLLFELHYKSDKYKEITIQRLGEQLTQVLHAATVDLNQNISLIDVIPESEKNWIMEHINQTQEAYDKEFLVISRFEAVAAQMSKQIALVYQTSRLTYEELNQRVNQLAHYLVRMGMRQDSVIGIRIEPSIEMVIAILATFKSGATYLPLDINAPRDRIEYILDHANVDALLVSKKTRGSVEKQYKEIVVDELTLNSESTDNLQVKLRPENKAYMIYTSGSTGKPKGVVVEQGNLNNYLNWAIKNFNINSSDRCMLLTSISFDISIMELFSTLLSGAQLHIMDRQVLLDAHRFGDYCRDNAITIWHSVPALMIHYLSSHTGEDEENIKIPSLRHIMLGGEAWSVDLAKKIHKFFGQAQITNMYGPTETTIWVTSHTITQQEIQEMRAIPIGGPIYNNKVYILDDNGNLCGVGMIGNLFIGGDNVTKGYDNNPEKTKEVFITHKLYGRLYCTGDLGEYQDDGTIMFQGRKDHQVKVRGYRIELGEIENVMDEIDGIQHAVVIVKQDDETNRLVCFYKATEEKTLNYLRTELAKKLPEYMIPSQFVYLAEFPFNANGKVDRKSLSAMEISARPDMENEYIEPVTENEKLIAKAWKKVLGIDRVGMNDDFFSLGGNSIKLVQVMVLLKEDGFEINMIDSFKFRTCGEMSKQIHPMNQKEFSQELLVNSEVEQYENEFNEYLPQVELETMEPYNETFYNGCFHNAYFPIVTYFHRSIPLYMSNDVVIYDAEEKSGDVELGINYQSRKSFEDINEDMGLIARSIVVTDKVSLQCIQSLSSNRPVIVPIDCYYESIRTDMYQQNHWPHYLVLYGYDREKKVFHIIEHDDINNLTFKKCDISFEDLEKCYYGYHKYFSSSKQSIYEFHPIDTLNNQIVQNRTCMQIYSANLMDNKELILNGLNKFQHFIHSFESKVKDTDDVSSLEIDTLVASINSIMNAKKSEKIKMELIFGKESSLIQPIEKIASYWTKMRLKIAKCAINMNYSKETFLNVVELFYEILDAEYSYHKALFEHISMELCNKDI